MRVRSLVLCVVLLGAALGAAGCSSSGGASNGKAPAGKPGGTVTVRSGGKVVCVITLDQNGTGTCKVKASQAPGKYTYTGSYTSSASGFKSGAGASTTLTVQPTAKASS
jgi:hypothetical protein